MDFKKRRELALKILDDAGINSSVSPYIRMLWLLGIKIPPPHFIKFWHASFIMGAPYSLLMGAFFSLGASTQKDFNFIFFAIPILIIGLIFGMAMGGYYAYSRKKHQLPSWEEVGA